MYILSPNHWSFQMILSNAFIPRVHRTALYVSIQTYNHYTELQFFIPAIHFAQNKKYEIKTREKGQDRGGRGVGNGDEKHLLSRIYVFITRKYQPSK